EPDGPITNQVPALNLEADTLQHLDVALAFVEIRCAQDDGGHQRASCETAGTAAGTRRRRRREVHVNRRSSRDCTRIRMLSAGKLPFTGLDIVWFVIAGFALLMAAGALWRIVPRTEA